MSDVDKPVLNEVRSPRKFIFEFMYVHDIHNVFTSRVLFVLTGLYPLGNIDSVVRMFLYERMSKQL